jgi:hypothetical protein
MSAGNNVQKHTNQNKNIKMGFKKSRKKAISGSDV